MMKRILFAAALLAALPWSVNAQVEKQVEVTKAYVPSVESASKLSVVPDMTDTVKMRPEIDYAITPLSLQTTLATRPIRPATVTYWEFNRPLPFYLKAGAGYPLNSVLDFYASSQNPGTGYVVGYVNHEGRYAKIKNDFGVKNNSTRMLNRIGAAAGKYLGKHILEGDVSYENRLYHRYGIYAAPGAQASYMPGARIDFGDANIALRFGDDFQDLSRVNFEIALHGGLFMDYPELNTGDNSEPDNGPAYGGKSRQTTLAAHGKIARAFGRHRLSAEVGYERMDGGKMLEDHRQQLVHAALRYGIEGGVVRLEAGADYYHDDNKGVDAENYILPFLRLDFNLGTDGLKPFVELDGAVNENSYRSLTRQNPYVRAALWGDKSSVDYNGRFGICGSIWRGKFDYRVYAGGSIRDNHIYWYGYDVRDVILLGALNGSYGRQTVFSFNGEVTWRPVSGFRTELAAHGYIYNDDDTKLHNGAPSFKGKLHAQYDGRKIAFGAGVWLQSVRKWSWVEQSASEPSEANYTTYEVPFAVDLRVNLDWKVSGRVTLFAEGRNLINRRLYEYPWHPEYGANFTVGVKANF